ncbi:hypothetical protein EGM70_05840 [Enterobacteriaceae bacterium 89]|nr:hypothetical protein [Enterobacteriaceae bacterium 89]
MPVEIQKIPEKIAEPESPRPLRWLIIIALITIFGVALSLYLWPTGMSTHTSWFWLCTLAAPLSVGVGCYAMRLRAYENERDRVSYWNHLRQEQHDRHVNAGQRPMGLLGKAYITPIARNKLAAALIANGSQLQPSYFATLNRSLQIARLSPGDDFPSETDYQVNLRGYLVDLLSMLEPDLQAAPGGLSVRLQHDGSLNDSQISAIWQDIFPAKFTVKELVVGTEGDDVMWMDPCLDRHEAELVLSVEINLFLEPRAYQAESVSALLLATPEWLAQHDAVPQAFIHRPVVSTEELHSVENMLRWGELEPGESHNLWRMQVSEEILARLIQQAQKIGYSPGLEEGYVLDDLFGRPGAAVGNITLICACEHAVASGKPQWIMTENKTVHQAIVRPA